MRHKRNAALKTNQKTVSPIQYFRSSRRRARKYEYPRKYAIQLRATSNNHIFLPQRKSAVSFFFRRSSVTLHCFLRSGEGQLSLPARSISLWRRARSVRSNTIARDRALIGVVYCEWIIELERGRLTNLLTRRPDFSPPNGRIRGEAVNNFSAAD